MLILRQSTAVDIRMGPFVDPTDGVTPVTGITLAAADQAEVLKVDGAATAAMAGTFAAVTGADGWYDYTVATGDVNLVGEVVFVVQDASACLPVFVRAMVVEEEVFDDLFTASAVGFLKPVTPGNDLDVTATGAAGIDWGNIENKTTANDLSATDIQLCDTTTAVTNDVGVDEWNGVALATTNPLPNAADGAAGGLITDATGITDVSAAINAQVVDVINTDTSGEPAQGAPGVTEDLRTKVDWLYKMMRNKVTNDGTTMKLYNDAGSVVDSKATVSEAGGLVTREEWITGP